MSAVKNFLITFSISVLLFGLAAYLIVSYAMDNNILALFSDNNNIQSNTNIPEEDDPDNIYSDEEYSEALDMEVNTVTALLIGTDYQPDVFNDYDLSDMNKNVSGFPYKERTISADSIILVHIDNDLKKFMISTIPSNMSVLLDGVYTKLNTLYSEKGVEFLCEKVTAVTGLYIDYYAVISFNDFADIIDELGGVSFNVPTDMVYEDPSQNLTINLSKGQQTLNGEKAVKLLRYRSYSDGDISRMDVTVDFMKTLLTKLTSTETFTKISAIYNKFINAVETNFTETDLTANIESILAYSVFETEVITYPGTSAGESFEPNISSAISLYKQYKK